MEIILTRDQFSINGHALRFPLNIGALTSILGPARHSPKKANHIYTWDSTGVYVYSKNGTDAESFALDLQPSDYDFSPRSVFSSAFTVEGSPLPDYYREHAAQLKKFTKRDESGRLIIGELEVWWEVEQGVLRHVNITTAPPPKVYSDKYRYQPVEGEKIEFTDFNFKLAVVQQLMYDKGLIQPVFDLYEFVENHREREIDIKEEGYAFIPEVTAYFEQLEVDRKFAGEITEINQDGGDEIYGHLLRFWDGEDDTFNITRFDDVQHFPNLRRMNLFYDKNLEQIRAQLAPKNIAVESI